MSQDEFNFLKRNLLDTMKNLATVRNVHEVYYMKGIIRTIEDFLYKFCPDSKLNELNHCIINLHNDY